MVPLTTLRFTARSTGLLASLFLAGCSLVNAPDEINLGSGGAPPATGGGPPAAGGSGGGGGAPPACTLPEDCMAMTTECATGDCVDGSCVAVPQPVDTACGPLPHDSCDLADACDGNGACVVRSAPNGTFCDDCAAGPTNCALCQEGNCGNCDTRATSKTFRSPLSASGWTLTGGWAVYAKTPPAQNGTTPPRCMDGIDNDGDTLIDFPDDLGCTSAFDDETVTARCANGSDDDGDGFIDLNDSGCTSANDDTEDEPPIEFEHPVLGTDGNRTHPYNWGGAEEEVSSATSPITIIPATLEFKSWNLDEGFSYDLKAVQLSLDGNSFTSIAVCPQNGVPFAFCEPTALRAANDWDQISLTVPAEFVNQPGYVRFIYDTGDGCCGFERGWYIDDLNFGADCACTANADCAYLDGACSIGTCDSTGECYPAAANVGDVCTLAGGSTADCSAPTCSANGLCESGGEELEGARCADCTDPDAQCDFCVQASCQDCPELQRFNDSTADVLYNDRWVFEGDWSFTNCITPNSSTPTEYLCFSATGMDPLSDPHVPPSLGNDGSRVYGSQPPTSEVENASFRTPNTLIPPTLTFRSWHQDRGGNNTFNLRDTKRIRVSLDDGATWTTMFDCDGNNTVAFCQPWPSGTNRTVDDWDDISLTVPNTLIGETGMFEFTYNTVDTGQGWERGWRLDDLNIARCD